MKFLEDMKGMLHAGDPVVRSWFLVDSKWAPFLLCAAYVFFVMRLGPDIMQDRKPFHLRLPVIIYNFSVVTIYVTCLFIQLHYFLTTDSYRKLCIHTPVIKNHYSYTCASAAWCIYILKYVEFMDSVFFVLRKKNNFITNLHVVHHATLPIISWVFLRTERSGFQFIPCGNNSFVHAIMYTYYGFAAMGPKIQRKLWWKEYLTLLQITQFLVVLFFLFIVVPLIGCKTSIAGIYVDIFSSTLFLALFCNFYAKTYKKPLLHPSQNWKGDVNNGKKEKDR